MYSSRPDWDDEAWRIVRRSVLVRDKNRCRMCRRRVRNLHVSAPDQAHVDHIIPLTLGGHPTDPRNLQTLCRDCNEVKSDSPGVGGLFADGTVPKKVVTAQRADARSNTPAGWVPANLRSDYSDPLARANDPRRGKRVR